MERWRRGKVNEVLRIIKINGACAGQRDNQRIHEKSCRCRGRNQTLASLQGQILIFQPSLNVKMKGCKKNYVWENRFNVFSSCSFNSQ
jgi:hypothetical protein